MKMEERTKMHTDNSKKMEADFITYTCTNHPEVIVNDPGQCPHCGKDLVKKY